MPGGDQQSDPIEAVQQTLQRYADGMQVSSEVTNFPNLVSDMKNVDPAKGEILEKGLAEIEKNPAKAKSMAQDLLKKLGLEKDDEVAKTK